MSGDHWSIAAIDPINFLAGRWTFDRRIRDRQNEASGRAHGAAVFEPEGDGLRWREEGVLEIGGSTTTATRELIIARDPTAPSGWAVLFDDGRPFHPLELSRKACDVEHPCRDDLYRGSYLVIDDDSFSTSWRVRGPAKHQLIETTYRLSPTDRSEKGTPWFPEA